MEREIYNKNSDMYWQNLDAELQEFAKEQGLEYKTNDDSFTKPFEAKPVIVNYFYHSKIKNPRKRRVIKKKEANRLLFLL